MPLPPKKRQQNRDELLKLLFTGLGDLWVYEARYSTDDLDLTWVPPTTWRELEEERLLYRVFNTSQYHLTGAGWMEGCRLTGQSDEPEFQRKLGRISAALKFYVHGRHADAQISLSDAAIASRLPDGFVANVIESGALESLFNKRGAKWLLKGVMIHIPLTFGSPLSNVE